MSFMCFVCRVSFAESTNPVSATKCGHLFHSDCLKKHFESLNACTPKFCPDCKEVLTSPDDVFPVSACTVDARDALSNQNQALVIQTQNIRRENQKLQIEVDANKRHHAYLASENDRCKKEIDRLKDIAISLTAKLFGNASPSSSSFPREDFSKTEKDSWLQSVQQSTSKPMPFWTLDDVLTNAFAILSPNKNECGLGLPQKISGNTQVHPGVTLPVAAAAEQSVAGMAFALNGNQAATTGNGKSDSERKMQQQPFPKKPTATTLTVYDLVKKSRSMNLAGSNGGSATEETERKEKYDDEDEEEIGDKDELETKESGEWYEKKRKGRRGGAKVNKGQMQSRSVSKDKSEEGAPLYGYFHCETCNAEWGSSRTFVNKNQTCRYCQTECEPFDQRPIIPRHLLHAMNNSQEENE